MCHPEGISPKEAKKMCHPEGISPKEAKNHVILRAQPEGS